MYCQKITEKGINTREIVNRIMLTFLVAVFITLVCGRASYAATKELNRGEVNNYGSSTSVKNYYMNKNILYYEDPKTGKSEKLVEINSEPYLVKHVVALCEGNVYISGSGDMYIDGNETVKTYVYNIKKKKIIQRKNVCITQTKGKYALTMDEYVTDVRPYSISLYKLTKNGMSKVVCLSKMCRYADLIGSGKKAEIYYTVYPKNDYSMKKMTLYRCKISNIDNNKKGTAANKLKNKTKKIETFKDPKWGGMFITYTNSKYCKIQRSDGYYKHYYKTDKFTPIKD